MLIWLRWVLAGASLVAQMVKSPPAVWEPWVQSLGWEDPLEKGMAIHSSILAWSIALDRQAWCTSVHEVLQARILEWVAFSLLQLTVPTQESNQGLLHCKQILYQLSYQGNPGIVRDIINL